MSRYFTAEEAKMRDVEAMGEVLGTRYSLLWQQVTLLHAYWHEFIELSGRARGVSTC